MSWVARAVMAEWRRVWSTRRWMWVGILCLVLVLPAVDVLGPFSLTVHTRPNLWDLLLYQFANRIAYPFGLVLGYCLWCGDLFDADGRQHYRWFLLLHVPDGKSWIYLVARAITIVLTAGIAAVTAGVAWFLAGWAWYGYSSGWSSFAQRHSMAWPLTPAVLHLSPLVVSLEAAAWAAAGVAAVALVGRALALWTDLPWTLPAWGAVVAIVVVWVFPVAGSLRWNILAQGMWIMHPRAYPGLVNQPVVPGSLKNSWSLTYLSMWAAVSGVIGWTRLSSRRDW